MVLATGLQPAGAGLRADHAVVVEPPGGDPAGIVLHDLLDRVRPSEVLERGAHVAGHPHADVLEDRRHAQVVAVGKRVRREVGERGGQVGAPERQAEAADVAAQIHAVGPAVRPAEVFEARMPPARQVSPQRGLDVGAPLLELRRESGRCHSPRARRSTP